jgi:type IV secretory pathway TrbF-like protein
VPCVPQVPWTTYRGDVPASDPSGRPRRPAPVGEPETFSISTAQQSLDDEMHHRMKRYLISMSVRTVCFILAVVLHGWLRWTMAGAAIVLPYVAVVMANAGPRKVTHSASRYSPRAIEGGPVHRIGTTPDD